MLQGIRVIDFSTLVGGPYAAGILADLGADVIKIEAPGGDAFRRASQNGFGTLNRNKRSLTIDLKHPDSAAVVERLAGWADVALEAFRPGVADRIGIGANRLRQLNPRLVYCSLSGYGQTGPMRHAAGHDFNFLAASGALAYTGHWQDSRPHRSGLPVTDVAGGTYSVIAILGALLRRHETGKGARLDVSFTDATMSFTAARGGLDVEQPGRGHLHPVNDLFDTSDGRRLAIGIVEQHFWESFVKVTAPYEPLLADARFDTDSARHAAGDELSQLVAQMIRGASAAEWLQRFSASDVPMQVVQSPYEASRSPQAEARGVVRELNGERHVPFPVLCDNAPTGSLRSVSPGLGEQTEEILSGLAFAADEIESMRRGGGCCSA